MEKRNDPKFKKRFEELTLIHKNLIIRPNFIYEGKCYNCKKNGFFLKTLEKGPKFKFSMFYLTINGILILFTRREILTFLGFKKNRDGKIGTCFNCGSIMIKCEKCNNIQNLEGEYQICKSCNTRIDKPDNFHNPIN